jgi:acetylxylan esterase
LTSRHGHDRPVEAISIQDGSHNIHANGMGAMVLAFVGLTTGTPPTDPPGPCHVAAPVNAWNSGLTETLTNAWNANYSPSGKVTATNLAFNGPLPPAASTGIGFQASHNGETAKATAFTLNGAPCKTG